MRATMDVMLSLSAGPCSNYLHGCVTSCACLLSGDFYKGVSNFVVIIIFAAPLMAIQYYTEQRLTLEWRRWLTNRLMMAYFSDQTFFRKCLGEST